MTDVKLKVLDALEKLRQREVVNKEPFKVRAYATVIKNLKASDKAITSLDDIKDIKGIGAKIHDKIKEILETGELKQLEKINAEVKIINELMQVHGIGPSKAKELVETHNIKSLEELNNHKNLLNDTQLIGLKYVKDFQERIPRVEMTKHDNYLHDIINKINPKLNIVIVGSYRRGAKDSGDIDMIITHEDNPTNYDHVIKDIVAALKKEKYLTDELAMGTHKYLGVCRMKHNRKFRRIDILYSTKEVWPFSILYFTGSLEFNVIIRKIALEKKLSLSEYGFKKINTDVLLDLSLYTEEDVLNYLGFKYVPPDQRIGNEKKLFEEYRL